MTFLPVSAAKLGIDLYGYEDLIKGIEKIVKMPLAEREKILWRASQEIPYEVIVIAIELVDDLASEKEAYEYAGIPYSKGPPEEESIFTTAVADYLLRRGK